MTQTVISSATAYCTATQFLQRYDYRTVGRLLADTDTTPTPQRATVLADTTLAAFLLEASGLVESALFVASRLVAADLNALAGTAAGELLAGLIADVCMGRVYDRRPDRRGEAPARVAAALTTLDALRRGEKIFGFQESADAGLLFSGDDNLAEDRWARKGAVVEAERFFGNQDWDGF